MHAIIDTGQADQVPARGWVAALAAACQESGLGPSPTATAIHSASSSSAAWGPASARLDPYESAHMFFTAGRGGQPGLIDISNWQEAPVTVAAQIAQVSAYPEAYAAWEPLAVQLVQSHGNTDPTCAPWTDVS